MQRAPDRAYEVGRSSICERLPSDVRTMAHAVSTGIASATNEIDLTKSLIYYLVMIRINIHEAKAHLSRYLARLRRGQVIVICKRNVPIAEIRALPPLRTKKRPVGLARGEFSVPASFQEPLPEEVVRGFRGEGG